MRLERRAYQTLDLVDYKLYSYGHNFEDDPHINELLVGEALKPLRNHVPIAIKFGIRFDLYLQHSIDPKMEPEAVAGVMAGNVVIPGFINPGHIRDNFALFDFELTDAEMSEIAALNQNKRYYTSTPEMLEGYAAFVPPVDEQKYQRERMLAYSELISQRQIRLPQYILLTTGNFYIILTNSAKRNIVVLHINL